MTKNSAGLVCAVGVLAFAAAFSPAAGRPQSAAAPSASAKLYVVPDLAERVAKFKLVHMPFNSAGLSAREKAMVARLVDASGLLDCIYWRQSDPQGLKLYLSLADSKDPQDELLRRYLKINGSRFDLIDDDKPFVGTRPMPPGRGFYRGISKAETLENFVKNYPETKSSIFSAYTIVETRVHLNSDESSVQFHLVAVPYHVEFKQFLEPMAADLRAAAKLSDDPAFAKFLRLRADALLTDDYYASDIAWLDLENPKFDVVFAPYEVYADSLLGVKTTYGASVMIRNDAESEKLALYQKYVPDLQEALPLPAADLPSKGPAASGASSRTRRP